MNPIEAGARAVHLAAFLSTEAAREAASAKLRRDEARVWRTMTPYDARLGRDLAERMGGRHVPRTTKAERANLADADERIALRHDQRAALFTESAALLRALTAETTGLGLAAAREPCQHPRRVTQDAALLAALVGEEK